MAGLHHTTGMTGDVQANVDFYVGPLGLLPVKRTVNHSDPSTLHLFYGDAWARPGTLMTFFAWPDTARVWECRRGRPDDPARAAGVLGAATFGAGRRVQRSDSGC